MSVNIKVRNIEVFHPKKKISNDYFIEHFKQQGKDIERLLEFMGKKERFHIDNPNENGLTMAIEACIKLLNGSGLSMADIDMIIYSTQLPEYTVPTNAIMLHRALNGNSKTRVLDMNASCAGMTVAVEQASNYMRGNTRIKRVLLVGSEQLSSFTNPEDEMPYSTFGDAACALILEATDEETGFIDAEYHTYTANANGLLYPEKGLSAVQQGVESGKYLKFNPFDISFASSITDRMLVELLERNNIQMADINAFCFSQMAFSDSQGLQERHNLDWEKILYVGDKYGYTGTTSPFLAFYEGIQEGKVKRGDTVLFWTVGAGHQFIAMLLKY